MRALFHFFHKLRNQRELNGADAYAIGRTFAPLLLRDARPGTPPVEKAVELVAFLVDHYEMVFADENENTGSDLINATLRALHTADRPQYAAVPFEGSRAAGEPGLSRRTERVSLVWVEDDADVATVLKAAGVDDFG